jgi:phage portal protein BeeE
MAGLNWLTSWLTKGAQATRGLRILPSYLSGMPLWNEWSHERAAREGYRANIWVYACVRARSLAASQIPFVVEVKGKAKDATWEPAPEHPLQLLLDKPFVRNGAEGLPTRTLDRQDLIEAATIYLDLSGSSPWILGDCDRNWLPQWIWPCRPDRMAPVPDSIYGVKGWNYTLDYPIALLAPEVLQHINFDPANDLTGLGPLQVAARTVDSDNEAINFNKLALQNRMVVDGVFSAKEVLNTPEFERMKAQIEERHGGARNARRPMLLEGGVEWKNMSLSPVDFDFIEGRKLNRIEICAVFRVPPELVGDSDHKTYNSFPEARRHFYEDTIIPYHDDLTSTVTNGLAIRYGDNVRVRGNYDAIPALAENTKDKLLNAKTMFAMGVPMKQVNERLKLGLSEYPGWDQPYLPLGLVPLGETPDVTIERDAANRGRLSGDTVPPAPNPAEPDPTKPEPPKGARPRGRKAWDPASGEDRAAYLRRIERERSYFEAATIGQAEDLFASHLAQIKYALFTGDKLIPDWEGALAGFEVAWEDDWLQFHMATDIAVIQRFGSLTVSELQPVAAALMVPEITEGAAVQVVFDAYADRVKRWIVHNTAVKVRAINATTMEGIKAIIQQAMTEGWPVPQIANALSDAYAFSAERAERIARTEIVAASNAGSHFGALQVADGGTDVRKHWLSSRDNRVRETHQVADYSYQTVGIPVRDAFVVGQSRLMFPGDSSLGAQASEVVECRCCSIYSIPGEEAAA